MDTLTLDEPFLKTSADVNRSRSETENKCWINPLIRISKNMVVMPKLLPGNNIISQLPDHISEKILESLEPDELEKCLNISQWKRIVNRDYYWKRHCYNHGMDNNELKSYQGDNDSNDLCTWLRIWLRFRRGTCYNWYKNNFKIKTLQVDGSCLLAANSKVVMIMENNHLVWRNICNWNLYSRKRLPFPPYTTPHFIMNESYVAVIHMNVIMFYKFVIGSSMIFPKHCVALKKDHTFAVFRQGSVESFINEHLNLYNTHHLVVNFFHNNYIYLKHKGLNFMIDILSGANWNMNRHYKSLYTPTKFIRYSRGFVKVSDVNGKNILSLFSEKRILNVIANHNMIAIFSSSNLQDMINMVTYQIDSRLKFLDIDVCSNSRHAIHPTRNIIYHFMNKTRIVAIDAESGEYVWNLHLDLVRIERKSSIKFICDRFIVISNPENPTTLVVCASTGKVINNYTNENGIVKVVNDNMIVFQSRDQIKVNIFDNDGHFTNYPC